MGCASSSNLPKDNDNNTQITVDGANGDRKSNVDEAQVKQQRRRLSVAPQHVGDVTKAIENKRGSISDAKSLANSGLSENEITCKGNIITAVLSRKGYVPYNKNKVNQDRYIIKFALQNDPEIALFGVMDGHGEFGHLVASFVEEKLPLALEKQSNLKTEPEAAITNAVKLMCDQLANTEINASFSGSTLVFGVKIGNDIYVANVGDSRCVLGELDSNGTLIGTALSIDQKPELPAEKQRIERAGGRVEPLPGPPGECGPPRVWLAEADVPGLAMSRSIGDDVSQTVGVISTPEIIKHTITSSDQFIVWASDGVWEFISSQQAADIINKHKHNIQEAAIKLVEESSAQWKKEEEVIDDITCVIIQFNHQK